MQTLKTLVPLSIVCTLLIGYSYTQGEWSEPGAGTIATTNTDAPITVGSVAQAKVGALSVGGLTSYANSNSFFNASGTQEFQIKPGFKGSAADETYTTLEMPGTDNLYVWDNFEVSNNIKTASNVLANKYCDANGNNCSTAADLSAISSFSYTTVTADDVKNIGFSQLPWGGGTQQPSSVTVSGYKYCGLTRKSERNDTFGLDTTYRGTSCDVNHSGTTWALYATVYVGSAGVRCEMTCFK